jgi:hypothetical protein
MQFHSFHYIPYYTIDNRNCQVFSENNSNLNTLTLAYTSKIAFVNQQTIPIIAFVDNLNTLTLISPILSIYKHSYNKKLFS